MVYSNYIHECCVGSTNTEGKPVYKECCVGSTNTEGKPVYKGH